MKIGGTTGKAELLRPQLVVTTGQQFTPLLNVKQAAEILGVSGSWVRRHKHELPTVSMGGLVRFDAALLSEHLRGRVTAGNSLKSERTPMEPSRYQRGSVALKGKVKTWYGTYREDVLTPAGTERRQRRVRLGTVTELPTKNVALNELAKKMDIAPTTDTTFQQLATRWQTAVGPTYKMSTLEHYTNAVRAYVLPIWKDRRITAITHEMIQTFLAQQAKTYSKSTLRSMRAVIRLILGWAVKNELMRKNPCEGIKLPVVANLRDPPQLDARADFRLGLYVARTLCNAGAVHRSNGSSHRGSCRHQGVGLRWRRHLHLAEDLQRRRGQC